MGTPWLPDFDSVVTTQVILPYRAAPYLRLSYEDPRLSEYFVFVIADSLAHRSLADQATNRLSTFLCVFPRPVLAEANTHRALSRNSASSRARSLRATIKAVMENPYIPLWTLNKGGMSGEYASAEVAEKLTAAHLLGRDKAVATALTLLIGPQILEGRTDTEVANSYEELLDYYYNEIYDKSGESSDEGLSAHKQDVNRGLEPYMYHEALFTSSYWDNWHTLRDHDEAAPAIRALAHLTNEALKRSIPVETELHLPFVEAGPLPLSTTEGEMRELLLLSATECAQISYKDKSRETTSTASAALGERLLKQGHLSPFEHLAFSDSFYDKWVEQNGLALPRESEALRSNLAPEWIQVRNVLVGGRTL